MKTIILAMTAATMATSAVTLAAPSSAAPKTPSDDVSAMHAWCGRPAPTTREGRIDTDAPAGGAVNQRNGTRAVSSTDCTIVGVLQPTDDAEYFCYTFDQNNQTWTYLRNTRTGIRGWARDDLLDGYGGSWQCEY